MKKERKLIHRLALRLLVVVASGLVFAGLATLFLHTREEYYLRLENATYAELYGRMLERQDSLDMLLDTLEGKDRHIYNEIFHSYPPRVDPTASDGFLAQPDTISTKEIYKYTIRKVDAIQERSAQVEANVLRAIDSLRAGVAVHPPLAAPLRGMAYPQIGASVGDKINPFFKVPAPHYGVDLVAQQGDHVFSAGRGVVQKVYSSSKGEGKVIEISHKGGYVSRYTHLGEVLVQPMEYVRTGTRIGTIGISGTTYATHLHYEIRRDSLVLDPVKYFFVGVSPAEYANMQYMAAGTKQSLD